MVYVLKCVIIVGATQTTVAGDGISNFVALTQRTVTVNAKDTGGGNIATGGDLFYILISNKWEKKSNFKCAVVNGADNTITTAITELMSDNNDGTYSYSWTPDNEGKLSISIIHYKKYSILGTYFNTVDWTGTVANTNFSSTINYFWSGGLVTLTQYDFVSSEYVAFLKAPVNGQVVLYMYVDNIAVLWVDKVLKFNNTANPCVWELNTTITMVKDQYYHIIARFAEQTGAEHVVFRWSYSNQAKVVVPANFWFYPEFVASSPYNVTITWPTGYTGTNTTNPNVWSEICGDNIRVGNEVCDHGNTLESDGWAADWRSIDTSWVWSGGTLTNPDVCSKWTSGLYQNDATTPTLCVPHWGDGFKEGNEKWDDGNTVNGDGCKGDWTKVEIGWVCIDGNNVTADTWTEWTPGFNQDNESNPEVWVTTCGDGFEAGSEKWDDGNNNEGVDGCKADCSSVDDGWVCSGGSSTSSDTCSLWADGFYQDNAINPEVWIVVWGDGVKSGAEVWDDGNTDAGDGWAADCLSIESNWVCRGGNPTSIDLCYLCHSGWVPNSLTSPETWIEICGDGLKVGSEKCDDENTLSGDGCTSNCNNIEELYIWEEGNRTTTDKWRIWGTNNEPNLEQSKWIPSPILNAATRMGLLYWVLIFVGIAFNFLTMMTSKNFSQSLFSMLNQGQIILLIPLIGVHVPEKFIDFNRVIDSCLGSFADVSKYIIPNIFDRIEDHNIEQDNWYLTLIEIESKNSLYSITGVLTLLTVLGIFHMFVYLLNDFSLEKKGGSNYSKTLHCFINWLTFGAYIRLFLFCYLFFLIISIDEVKNPANREYDLTSYYFSWILLIFSLFSTVLLTFHAIQHSSTEDSQSKGLISEIFNAIKMNKLCQLYYPIFLIRRLVFVLILFTVESLNHEIKITLICGTQGIYFIYILISRPFLRVKDNFGEIINEIFLCFLFGFLMMKVQSKEWSDREALIFYGAIIGNAVLFIIIAIGKVMRCNILRRRVSSWINDRIRRKRIDNC